MSTQNIITLFKKYEQGEMDPSEKKTFLDWCETCSLNDFDNVFKQALPEQQALLLLPLSIDKRQAIERALDAAEVREVAGIIPVHHIHFLKTSWFRYAAAVIILLGVGILWFIVGQRFPAGMTGEREISMIKQDIAPGTNKAVLTIGNNKIDLASNKAGITINSVITYMDGEKIVNASSVIPAGNFLQLTTPRGGQYQAVLPDGTKVWLNAASSIKFPCAFTGKERVVEITGESYLEVAADKTKPFLIKTNQTIIQVLGTSFNVNAYTDEVAVKTTLLEGSIKINNIILKPGEAYYNGKVVAANVEKDIAWKNGWFAFTDADLSAVMRQLARWYNVEIVFARDVPQWFFSGKIDRSLPLSEVLAGLSDTKVNYKITGNKVIILP